MNNSSALLGLDIGGAHLKAALLDQRGIVQWVMQLPCPLWRGLNYLEQALDEVLARDADAKPRCAVTMTGELADIFTDRRDGVLQLTAAVTNHLAIQNVVIYAGQRSFVAPMQVGEHAANIASANWLASAQFVAAQVKDGLVVDIGSTTTDLIVVQQGQAVSQGFNDAERLRTRELVYTGVVRTPVMAITQKIHFGGAVSGVAAERFATMSDVYRLTGELENSHDMADTADGAEKTPQHSARRLARMIGYDLQDVSMAAWQELAAEFKREQLKLLQEAAEQVIVRNALDAQAPVIGAGAGRFLARQLATQMGRNYMDIADLIQGPDEARQWAAVCAPAFAVAWLAARSPSWQF